jgi:hypothetical protein
MRSRFGKTISEPSAKPSIRKRIAARTFRRQGHGVGAGDESAEALYTTSTSARRLAVWSCCRSIVAVVRVWGG